MENRMSEEVKESTEYESLMGVKEKEEVIIPSFTFVAAANAVMYCSAIPHLVDIEDQSFMVAQLLEDQ